MFKTIEEQHRWIKLRQQLLSAMGPVERAPQEWKMMLERMTIDAMPRRTYRFGLHNNCSAVPKGFRGLERHM